jgi:hypothetical protein
MGGEHCMIKLANHEFPNSTLNRLKKTLKGDSFSLLTAAPGGENIRGKGAQLAHPWCLTPVARLVSRQIVAKP